MSIEPPKNPMFLNLERQVKLKPLNLNNPRKIQETDPEDWHEIVGSSDLNGRTFYRLQTVVSCDYKIIGTKNVDGNLLFLQAKRSE
jgi:hypothetical protein